MLRTSPRAPGQALAEFALVIPIVLVLFLAIADLGRLFAAGIVVQSASRDGAEAGAQYYAQIADGSTVSAAAVYTTVDNAAVSVTCNELSRIGGATGPGTSCSQVQAVVVACTHDVGFDLNGTTQSAPGDPNCAAPPSGSMTPGESANCGGITSTAWSTSLDSSQLPYVEVRVCYPFDLLLGSSYIPAGPFYLQQNSSFVVAAYPTPSPPPPGSPGVATSPIPNPSASASASPTPSPVSSPSASASASASPSATPTTSPNPTPTLSPAPTPSPSPAPSLTPTATPTPAPAMATPTASP